MIHRTGRGSKPKTEAKSKSRNMDKLKTESRDENVNTDIPLKYLMGPAFGVVVVAATLIFGETN